MKITVCFLMVAISCFFSPATSDCFKRCYNSCQVQYMSDLSCLKNALALRRQATAIALSEFMCAYDRCRNTGNKAELFRAINKLMGVTGCSLRNLLGPNVTVKQLLNDVDGVLHNLLTTAINLVVSLNLGSLVTPKCGLLPPVLQNHQELLYSNGKLSGGTRSFVESEHVLGEKAPRNQGPLGGLASLSSLTGINNSGGILGGVSEALRDVGSVVRKATETISQLGVGGVAAGLTDILPVGNDPKGRLGSPGSSAEFGGIPGNIADVSNPLLGVTGLDSTNSFSTIFEKQTPGNNKITSGIWGGSITADGELNLIDNAADNRGQSDRLLSNTKGSEGFSVSTGFADGLGGLSMNNMERNYPGAQFF
ncbi:Hypothetical predicted protein [Pelobates cultripes]|uniref:Uncharacterized protein n=1 Tax=Pelobates cultripes TaxID=61616 RepID=A0AAD1RR80_PELCU|nr:Hypothetical predicted protein [Pelobates cultripes]